MRVPVVTAFAFFAFVASTAAQTPQAPSTPTQPGPLDQVVQGVATVTQPAPDKLVCKMEGVTGARIKTRRVCRPTRATDRLQARARQKFEREVMETAGRPEDP